MLPSLPFNEKITFRCAKRCDRLPNNAIAVMTTNQVKILISGQQGDKNVTNFDIL